MEYMTIKETAEKWNLSVRRVQTICNEGMIDGAMKFGNIWAILRNRQIKELSQGSMSNPVFDRRRLLYIYKNGLEQKLVLNQHL